MKNNIDFYQHFANADQHPKFKMLRVKYGWAGEGMFWALNNRIALSEDCCLDISKKYNCASLALDLGFSVDEFEEFLNYLLDDCELVKLHADGCRITTDIVQENYKTVMGERAKARDRAARRTPKQPVASPEKETISPEKTCKVKESKGKEIKEKEIIKKKKPANYSKPIPEDFPITEQMIAYAKKKNYVASLEDLTEGFLIHHRAKGTKWADWYAAWQKWLRNQLAWYPEKNIPPDQSDIPNIKPTTYAQAQDLERRQQIEMLRRYKDESRQSDDNAGVDNPEHRIRVASRN